MENDADYADDQLRARMPTPMRSAQAAVRNRQEHQVVAAGATGSLPVFRVWWKGQLVGTEIWGEHPKHVDQHLLLSRTGRVFWLSHAGLEEITADCRVEILANAEITDANRTEKK